MLETQRVGDLANSPLRAEGLRAVWFFLGGGGAWSFGVKSKLHMLMRAQSGHWSLWKVSRV